MTTTYTEPRVWTKSASLADGGTHIQPIPFFNPKLGIHIKRGTGATITCKYTTASMAEIQAATALWSDTSLGASVSADSQVIIDNAVTAIKITSTGGTAAVTFTQ